jgi:hypothetical protein
MPSYGLGCCPSEEVAVPPQPRIHKIEELKSELDTNLRHNLLDAVSFASEKESRRLGSFPLREEQKRREDGYLFDCMECAFASTIRPWEPTGSILTLVETKTIPTWECVTGAQRTSSRPTDVGKRIRVP